MKAQYEEIVMEDTPQKYLFIKLYGEKTPKVH